MATRSSSPNPSRSPNPNTCSSSSIKKNRSLHNLSKDSVSADDHQRSSGLKMVTALPSLRASFEQKGNERDHSCSKQGRVRSPAMASSKNVAKNFMAPTISASSKVVAASPRKKILGERNEVASASEEFVLKCEHGFSVHMLDTPKISKALFGRPEMDEEFGPKPEIGSGQREIEMKNQENLVLRTFPLSPVVVPHEADSYLPPYDPKTNYLSPRPRFLHYKPNPRIEQYLNKEGDIFEDIPADGKRLEDSFSSESIKETTLEQQSSDLQESSEEEHSSSVDAEAEVEQSETNFLEPISEINPLGISHRSCSHSRKKVVPLLLILVIAFLGLPLSDSPIISSPSTFKDRSFVEFYTPAALVLKDLHLRHHLHEVAAVANSNLERLVNRVSLWSFNTIAYFTNLVSPRKEEWGFFHQVNLTTSAIDRTIDFCFMESRPTDERHKHSVEDEKEPQFEGNTEGELEEDGDDESFLDSNPRRKAKMDASEDGRDSEPDVVEFLVPGNVKECDMEHDSGTVEKDVLSYVQDNDGEAEKTETISWQVSVEGDDLSSSEIVVNTEEAGLENVKERDTEHDSGMVEKDVLSYVQDNDGEAEKTETIPSQVSIEGDDLSSSEIVVNTEEDGLENEKERDMEYDSGTVEKEVLSYVQDNDAETEETETITSRVSVEGDDLSASEIVVNTEEGGLMEENRKESPLSHEVQSDAEEETGNGLTDVVASVVPEPQKLENQDDENRLDSAMQPSSSVLVGNNISGSGIGLKLQEIMSYEVGGRLVVCMAAIATVIGSVVVLYGNHIKSPVPEDNEAFKSVSGSGENYGHFILKSPLVLEMVGNSGSLEVSSSFNNSGSSGQQRTIKRGKGDESPSLERNLRRDSAASSSISYGSFTTYERVSAKKGAKEEVVVTPVRRSSRIRNQLASP